MSYRLTLRRAMFAALGGFSPEFDGAQAFHWSGRSLTNLAVGAEVTAWKSANQGLVAAKVGAGTATKVIEDGLHGVHLDGAVQIEHTGGPFDFTGGHTVFVISKPTDYVKYAGELTLDAGTFGQGDDRYELYTTTTPPDTAINVVSLVNRQDPTPRFFTAGAHRELGRIHGVTAVHEEPEGATDARGLWVAENLVAAGAAPDQWTLRDDQAGSVNVISSTFTRWLIGAGFNNELFEGTIYELLVYDRPLTDAEIAQVWTYLDQVLVASSYHSTVVTTVVDGLESYAGPGDLHYFYPLDESGGLLANDAGGDAARDGTITVRTDTDSDLVPNSYFPRSARIPSTGRIEAPGGVDINSASYTVFFFARMTSVARALFGVGDDPGLTHLVVYETAETYRIRISDGTTPETMTPIGINTQNPPDGTWHHFAIRIRGNSDADLFIDGHHAGTINYSGTLGETGALPEVFNDGAGLNKGNTNYVGAGRINALLSSLEIAQLALLQIQSLTFLDLVGLAGAPTPDVYVPLDSDTIDLDAIGSVTAVGTLAFHQDQVDKIHPWSVYLGTTGTAGMFLEPGIIFNQASWTLRIPFRSVGIDNNDAIFSSAGTGPGDSYMALFRIDASTAAFRFYYNGANFTQLEYAGNLWDGDNHTIVARFNAATNMIALWVDGAKVGQVSVAGIDTLGEVFDNPLYIGERGTGFLDEFEGWIGPPAFWATALSDGVIEALEDSAKATNYVPDPDDVFTPAGLSGAPGEIVTEWISDDGLEIMPVDTHNLDPGDDPVVAGGSGGIQLLEGGGGGSFIRGDYVTQKRGGPQAGKSFVMVLENRKSGAGSFSIHSTDGGNKLILFWSTAGVSVYSPSSPVSYTRTDVILANSIPGSPFVYGISIWGTNNYAISMNGQLLHQGTLASVTWDPTADWVSYGQEWDGVTAPSNFLEGIYRRIEHYHRALTVRELCLATQRTYRGHLAKPWYWRDTVNKVLPIAIGADVIHYDFQDTSRGDVFSQGDGIGGVSTTTLSAIGGIPQARGIKVGSTCFEWDGSAGQYLRANTATAFDFIHTTGDFLLDTLVRIDAVDQTRSVCGHTTGFVGHALYFDEDDITFTLTTAGGQALVSTPHDGPGVYHITIRGDGTDLELLINGELVDTAPLGAVPQAGASIRDWYVGGNAGRSYWWDGLIDHITIRNDGTVTDAQILDLVEGY